MADQIPVLTDPKAPRAHEHAVREAKRGAKERRAVEKAQRANYVEPETGDNVYCRSHEERAAGLS